MSRKMDLVVDCSRLLFSSYILTLDSENNKFAKIGDFKSVFYIRLTKQKLSIIKDLLL